VDLDREPAKATSPFPPQTRPQKAPDGPCFSCNKEKQGSPACGKEESEGELERDEEGTEWLRQSLRRSIAQWAGWQQEERLESELGLDVDRREGVGKDRRKDRGKEEVKVVKGVGKEDRMEVKKEGKGEVMKEVKEEVKKEVKKETKKEDVKGVNGGRRKERLRDKSSEKKEDF